MAFGMIMRSSKLRTGLYVLVAMCVCLTIYMLRSTHSELNDTKNQYEACQQQKDSLLAQMQVVYEQKNRVEKYLQQERQEHKQTKAEHQKSNEMRLLTEKDKREIESKYTELQKDNLLLDEKKQQLEQQIIQLQEAQNQKEDEKKHMQSEFDSQLQEFKNSKNEEIERFKGQINILQAEKEVLQQQVQVQDAEQINKLQMCHQRQNELEKQLIKMRAVHPNNSFDLSPKPQPAHSEEAKENDNQAPKEKKQSQKAGDAGEGVNNVVHSANNNEPDTKIAQLPAIGEGGGSKKGGGSHDAAKDGRGGGGGGGSESVPTVPKKDENNFQNSSPLKHPALTKTTTKKDAAEDIRNPNGLLEQIQPPNSDNGNLKKQNEDKNAEIGDLKNEIKALKDMRPQLVQDSARKDDIRFHGPDPRLMAENHYAAGVGPIGPHHMPDVIKRGPQPDHMQGHFNQIEDDRDYADEGDDDNAEEQDGDNEHPGNKKIARDQDFDDQDNVEAMENNHQKESVMLAPR